MSQFTHFNPARCRGAAMVLVMIIAAMGCIIGLTFLSTADTATVIARSMDEQAQARQVAEGGIGMALHYLSDASTDTTLDTEAWLCQDEAMDLGMLSLVADFQTSTPPTAMTFNAPSFESGTGSLYNGLLGLVFPTLSGTIGEWHLERRGLLGGVTTATVPQMGISNSPHATHSNRIAYLTFVAGVLAEGTFTQTIANAALPNSRYTISVDLGKAGLATVLAAYEIRVECNGTLLASSANGSFISLLDLNPNFKRMKMTFTTGPTPPTGTVRLKLIGRSVLGVVTGIAFDHIVASVQPIEPITVRSIAEVGSAREEVTASVMVAASGNPRVQIVGWHNGQD